jgi:hypothetical protein
VNLIYNTLSRERKAWYTHLEVRKMDAIVGLQKMMKEAEAGANHHGYWYSVSEALIIMVCGMLCSLQTIDDIHEWSQVHRCRRS